MAKKIEAFRLSGRVEIDERGAKRALQTVESQAKQTRGILDKLKTTLSGGSGGGGFGGNFLPGLSYISEIIQGIPQIGRLVGGLVSPLTDAAQEGIRFNTMLDNARSGFEGIAGSAEAAADHVKALQKLANDKRVPFEGVLEAAQAMKVYNFSLEEQLTKLPIWMDAIAAGGKFSADAVEGVARAFGQMRAKGTVSAEEMEQLAERGVDGWNLLAKSLGLTVGETRKLAEQGRINGKVAVDLMTEMIALDSRYQGQLDRRGKKLSGQLDLLANITAAAKGGSTEQLTKDLSETLEEGLKIAPLAQIKLQSSINSAISPVSGLLKNTAKFALGGGLTEGFVEGLNVGQELVKRAISEMATNAAIAPFKQILGIESPSKVFEEFGLMCAKGFNNGFTEGMKKKQSTPEDEIKARIARIRKAVTDPDVRAFMDALREIEGGSPDIMAGGRRVKDLSKHPGLQVPSKKWFRGPAGKSSASGNWQITLSNWKEIAPLLGLTDFSEESQLQAALWLLDKRGGLQALLNDDFLGAAKATQDWAASPFSTLPGRKRKDFLSLIDRNLGRGGFELPGGLEMFKPQMPSGSRSGKGTPGGLDVFKAFDMSDPVLKVLFEQRQAVFDQQREQAEIYAQRVKEINFKFRNSSREELNSQLATNKKSYDDYLALVAAAISQINSQIKERQSQIQRPISIDKETPGGLDVFKAKQPETDTFKEVAVNLPLIERNFKDILKLLPPLGRDIEKLPIKDVRLNLGELNEAAQGLAQSTKEAAKETSKLTKEQIKANRRRAFGTPPGIFTKEKREVRDDDGNVIDNPTKIQSAISGLKAAFADLKGMGKEALGQFAQGIGGIAENFVLMGETGPAALRKLTAQVLASLTAQAAMKAIFYMAEGFAALARWDFTAATNWFTSAGIMAGIAGLAALGGRKAAGNLFNGKDQQQQQAPQEQQNTSFTRRAFGGQVFAGRGYIINDANRTQEEVYVPDQNGYIYPSVDAYGRSSRRGGSYTSSGSSELAQAAKDLREVIATLRAVKAGKVLMKGIKERRGAILRTAVSESGSMQGTAMEFNRRLGMG